MNKMILEMQIAGKNKKQILKRLLTVSRHLIDNISDLETRDIFYRIKKQ